MASRRTAKVSRAILETVSSTVLHGLKDPRVKNVTVIHVDASEDIRSAKVYVSVMGDEKVQALTMRGLKAARGFLQSQVAERLQTKHTPILTFLLDSSVKRSAASSALIREALAQDASVAGSAGADEFSAADALESTASEIASAGIVTAEAADLPKATQPADLTHGSPANAGSIADFTDDV